MRTEAEALETIRQQCRLHANIMCQHVGCTRPSTWTPIVLLTQVGDVEPCLRVGSTLGFCSECRLYIIEAVLPRIAHDAYVWLSSNGFNLDPTLNSWEIVRMSDGKVEK